MNWFFSFSGNKEVECTYKVAHGRSGGLLTMWKSCLFVLRFNFIGEDFMGIHVV